jgi:hypothetical protein
MERSDLQGRSAASAPHNTSSAVRYGTMTRTLGHLLLQLMDAAGERSLLASVQQKRDRCRARRSRMSPGSKNRLHEE